MLLKYLVVFLLVCLTWHCQAQQDTAAQISTYVNHAYGTLGDPVKRAFYILRREGIPDVSESEQSLEDPTLIMDIMELRESIESAESQEVVDSIRDANKSESSFSL